MRASLLIAASIVGTALPLTALAAENQTLEFAAGSVNATWEGLGPITMEQLPGGIILQSTGTGLFLTSKNLTFMPDAGGIVASAEEGTNIYFVWTYATDPEQITHSLKLRLPAGQVVTTNFPLSNIATFREGEKRVGVMLPPGTRILLHRMQFGKWNVAEKFIEALLSFWVFDAYRPYSINFVWGPQFAFNPVERSDLFMELPPTSVSATFVMQSFLLALFIILGILALYLKRPSVRRRLLMTGFTVSAVLWILFDLRMGSEFLAWVREDQRMFIGGSPVTRAFRDRDQFYDFASFAAPLVRDRSSYIFFAEEQWPYLGNMRYLTYPAIPGIALGEDDTWVIYRRPDITVGPGETLMYEGESISGQGKVLGRFDDDSFVFRTNERPAQ